MSMPRGLMDATLLSILIAFYEPQTPVEVVESGGWWWKRWDVRVWRDGEWCVYDSIEHYLRFLAACEMLERTLRSLEDTSREHNTSSNGVHG